MKIIYTNLENILIYQFFYKSQANSKLYFEMSLLLIRDYNIINKGKNSNINIDLDCVTEIPHEKVYIKCILRIY